MVESKVPGMARWLSSLSYIRYYCAECGDSILASEDDALCEKHGKMTSDAPSIDERKARIHAERQASQLEAATPTE